MPQVSPSTVLIGASEKCLLAFTPQKQLVCALYLTRQVVGVWPYASLRNYWGGRDQFGFIAGRRAPRGEGKFTFTTQEGEVIFQMLERLIKATSDASSLQADCTPEEIHYSEVRGEGTRVLPIPSKPQDLRGKLSTPEPVQLLHRQSVHSLSHTNSSTGFPSTCAEAVINTDISDTSPAYLTHSASGVGNVRSSLSRTASSVSTFSSSSVPLEGLHSRKARFPSPLLSSSTPSKESSDQDEDATYSLTLRNLPVQFTRNASLKLIGGNSIYNGLVRSESLGSSSTRCKAKKTASAAPSYDSTGLYDLVYRPNQPSKVLQPVQEGDYGSIGDSMEQQRELRERNLLKSTNNNVVSLTGQSEQLHRRVEGVDGGTGGGSEGVVSGSGDDIVGRETCAADLMTRNPMYDSKDNIFSDDVVNIGASVSREMDRTSTGSQGSKRGVVEDYRVERMMGDMVLNPVYGDHHPPNLRTNPAPKNNMPEIHILPGHKAATVPGEGQPSKEEAPKSPLVDGSMVDNPVYGDQKDSLIVNSKTEEVDGCALGSDIQQPMVSGVAIAQDRVNKTADCVDRESPLSSSSQDKPTAHTTTSPNHVAQDGSMVLSDQAHREDSAHTKDSAVVHRDALGYSKVDKTCLNNTKAPKEDSPPPPLPPRIF